MRREKACPLDRFLCMHEYESDRVVVSGWLVEGDSTVQVGGVYVVQCLECVSLY